MITFSKIYENVATLLNRTDLDNEIPTYVRLAELELYRYLRIRDNEQTLTLTASDDPTSPFDLPNDFKEMRLVVVNDIPLIRISDQRYYDRLKDFNREGMVTEYATIDNQLYVLSWPTETPADGWDADTKVVLHYYNEDAQDMLETAEDAFTYGGAYHAGISLKAPQDEINLYEKQFTRALQSLDLEHKRREYAGSTVSVSNAYGNIGHRSRYPR